MNLLTFACKFISVFARIFFTCFSPFPRNIIIQTGMKKVQFALRQSVLIYSVLFTTLFVEIPNKNSFEKCTEKQKI